MNAIKVNAIPTLRQLYKKGVIPVGSSTSRTSVQNTLLDRISLWQGDVTKLDADAIVNAANGSLLGGGGVDGAIHRAAGPELLKECRTLRGCETGDAKITKGYRLPAKHVIHTVGPIYAKSQDDECARLLASCYDKCLQLAVGLDLATIAFPSISMGVYGYPPKDGAKITLSTIRNYLELNPGKLSQVILVVFSSKMMDVYLAQISEIFPPDVDCELDSVGL